MVVSQIDVTNSYYILTLSQHFHTFLHLNLIQDLYIGKHILMRVFYYILGLGIDGHYVAFTYNVHW